MDSTEEATKAEAPRRGISPADRAGRQVPALLAFVAMTLAVAAALHLTGHLFHREENAGVAEAIIAVVLGGAVVRTLRNPARARATGVAAAGFATVGVVAGLGITIGEGHVLDIAYHAAILPLLIAGIVALLPVRPKPTRWDIEGCPPKGEPDIGSRATTERGGTASPGTGAAPA